MRTFLLLSFRSDIRRNAAALSYYFVSALIPLAFLVTVAGQLVTDGQFLKDIVRNLFQARVGTEATNSLVNLITETFVPGFSPLFLIIIGYALYSLSALTREVVHVLSLEINGRNEEKSMQLTAKRILLTIFVFISIVLLEGVLPLIYQLVFNFDHTGQSVAWSQVILAVGYRIVSIIISAAFFSFLYQLLSKNNLIDKISCF